MLTYFSHNARRGGHSLEKFIMLGRVEGRRKTGRTRTRWTDQIKSLAGSSSLQDRQRSHAIVHTTNCHDGIESTNNVPKNSPSYQDDHVTLMFCFMSKNEELNACYSKCFSSALYSVQANKIAATRPILQVPQLHRLV